MLTKDDIVKGNRIAAVLGGYVSGSVIIDPDEANDFDIFMGRSAFYAHGSTKPHAFHLTTWKTGGGLEQTLFVDTWDDRSEYYQSNNTDNALYCTYRSECGKYNLIVVEDDFVLAFKISANIMEAHPESYRDRDERIRLHHCWREHIRKWLSHSFAMGDALVTYGNTDKYPSPTRSSDTFPF